MDRDAEERRADAMDFIWRANDELGVAWFELYRANLLYPNDAIDSEILNIRSRLQDLIQQIPKLKQGGKK